MDIRRLRYFIVVAEELHFTRAAERLNISQPPLSQHIKILEEEVGAKLLRRTNRSVALTPAGRALYEQIVPWISTLDAIAERVRRIDEGEEGELNVTCSFSTAQPLLPRAIYEYNRRYPKISVKLQELPSDVQVNAVVKGITDAGIMRLPVNQSHLAAVPLYDEGLMVALKKSHPLAARKQLSVIDLRHETILKTSHQTATVYASVEAICRQAGFDAKVVDVSSNLNTALGLVGIGMGVALVPESIGWARPNHVVYVPLTQSPRSTVAAVWRRDNISHPLALFIELTRQLSTMQDVTAAFFKSNEKRRRILRSDPAMKRPKHSAD